MTTEEIKKTEDNMLAATKVVPAEDIALGDEDEFLRELRELAGMDEQKPASPIGAANAGKATSLSAEPAPQPEPEPQPVAQEQPAYAPADEPAQSAAQDEDDDGYFFAGWQKGLMLLVASASVLVLTVLAVLNALQV